MHFLILSLRDRSASGKTQNKINYTIIFYSNNNLFSYVIYMVIIIIKIIKHVDMILYISNVAPIKPNFFYLERVEV